MSVKFEYTIDLGVVGDCEVDIEVDLEDITDADECVQAFGIASMIEYEGSEDTLDHIDFDEIAAYATNNGDVLKRVLTILEDKYA